MPVLVNVVMTEGGLEEDGAEDDMESTNSERRR